MATYGDIQPYDWNEGRIEKSNSEIIKKIEVEEKTNSLNKYFFKKVNNRNKVYLWKVLNKK